MTFVALVLVLTGLHVLHDPAEERDLASVQTCFITGGGQVRVCHAVKDEGVFYKPAPFQLAYNTQIIALGDGKYETVLHSEAKDLERHRSATGQLRPGDSIKTGLVDASGDPTAAYKAPQTMSFRIWGSLTNPASPLYYADDKTNPEALGFSGGANPMVVHGPPGDPFYYMYYLGVESDGLRGTAWRNVLLEARTRDFVGFDLLETAGNGAPAWRPFAGDAADPALVTDGKGEALASNQTAPVEPPGSSDPVRPAGAVVTTGVFGSVVRVDGLYHYFYTNQDAVDPSKSHLYVRTTRDISTNGVWSQPRILLDTPKETLIRVAKAKGMDRWAVFYTCLRSVQPAIVDVCLQYTETMKLTGPGSIGTLRPLDAAPSPFAMGLAGGEQSFHTGSFLKIQQFYMTDPDGNLTAPPGARDQIGGLVTWTDLPISLNIFGAPVYWGTWDIVAVKPK